MTAKRANLLHRHGRTRRAVFEHGDSTRDSIVQLGVTILPGSAIIFPENQAAILDLHGTRGFGVQGRVSDQNWGPIFAVSGNVRSEGPIQLDGVTYPPANDPASGPGLFLVFEGSIVVPPPGGETASASAPSRSLLVRYSSTRTI
jgi:hypothetical protein